MLNRVQCFPLICSDREAGVINYFFSSTLILDPIAIKYFTEFLEAIGQVISNHISREKELSIFRQLHSWHSTKRDLGESLVRFLENIQIGSESDFILIFLPMGLPAEFGNNKKVISSIITGENSPYNILDEALLEKLSDKMNGSEGFITENVYSNQLGKNEKLLVFSFGNFQDKSFGIVVFG